MPKTRSDVLIVSSDEDDNCDTRKVWSKGEACLAPYSGDGEFYPAHIKKLLKGDGSQTGLLALVRFDEYESEENEQIPISNLKTPTPTRKLRKSLKPNPTSSPNTSIFKPLWGNEEEKRLEGKYDHCDSDEDDDITPKRNRGRVSEWKMCLNSSQKSQRKRKLPVVTGGGKKTKDKAAPKIAKIHSSQESTISSGGKEQTPVASTRNKKDADPVRERKDPEKLIDAAGFNEEDLEKPNFSFTTSAAKVPYQLSRSDASSVIQVPATINQYLRDYQREGIKFMYSHYVNGRGAILGDDMGLGKTVQVIGLLAALLHKQGNHVDIMRQRPKFIRELSDSSDLIPATKCKPFLIIGPGSVLYNWLDELETWGYFTARKFHGADKQSCLAEVRKGKVEVVVTTFETFRDNLEDLNSVDWEAVIVDEVHRIKGLKAQTTQALRCVNTKLRYGLTGTALQNNMTELWCILDWAQPEVLGSLGQFELEYVQVIERGQRHDATKRELALARKKKEEFSQKRLAMMIRRTKKLIADQLPGKDDNVVFCKLTPLQESVYRAVLGHRDMSLVLRMDDPCDCESGRKRSKCCYKVLPDGSKIMSVMFSFMHLLLKTANHVALLTPHADASDQQKRRTRDVCNTAFKDHPQFLEQSREASFRTLSDPKFCGKMKVLQGLLSVFSKSHSKVLVFSYSTRLLDILEQYVIADGHEYRRIDGSVNNRRRMDIVREFNRDQNIFICLISTKAGGLGLNLTGANKVVIFDPNWNPSHDLQAQDRAYRIGQRKNVAVYRLISVGTIEENIYLRQIYKQQLGNVAVCNEAAKRFFHGIQGDHTHKGELFGVKNMFQLRTGDSCLTMDILERNEKVETGLRAIAMSKYVALPTEDDVTDEERSEDEEPADMPGSGDESEDALRHLLDLDNDSGLDLDSPPPSPESKTNVIKSKMKVATPKKVGKDSTRTNSSPSLQSFVNVDSVFAKCGVMHVHENPKVIGSSRAEEHMSRCAIQDVYELHQNSQVPAMEVDPISESSEEEEEEAPPPKKSVRGGGGGRGRKAVPDHNTPRVLEHGTTRILIAQTPTAIRRQHWSKMCEGEGESQMSVAEKILSSDTETRLEMLKRLYSGEHPDLEEVINSTLSVTAVDATDTGNSTKKNSSVKKSQPKSRGRPRKAKQGLTFMDDIDSESQSIEAKPGPSTLQRDDSRFSSLEVGRAKRGRVNTRVRTPRGRRTQTLRTLEPESVPMTRHKSNIDKISSTSVGADMNLCEVPENRTQRAQMRYQDSDSLFETVPKKLHHLLNKPVRKVFETDLTFSDSDDDKRHKMSKKDNVDDLLDEIGQDCNEDEEVEKTETSILDDIFFSAETKRKPAPSKSKKNVDSFDLFSPKSSASENDTTDFLNNSTLVDDSVDCFSEHKWKKKRNSPGKSPTKRVDRLLQESADDFERLLDSGKLRKRTKRKYKWEDQELSPQEESKPRNDSASLFS